MQSYAAGVASAAGLIFITTADDAVWLVPYLSPTRFTKCAITAHAFSFCCALQVIIWAMAVAVRMAHHGALNFYSGSDIDRLMQHIGCAIAWIISIYSSVKAYRKYHRKARERQLYELQQTTRMPANDPKPGPSYTAISTGNDVEIASTDMEPLQFYGSINEQQEDQMKNNEAAHGGTSPSPRAGPTLASVSTCVWLSLIGCLDELSYFPSLLLTKTYTVWQLSIGALIATISIVSALTLARRFCSPWLKIFDRIPLYLVTIAFAVYMTLGLVWDK